MSIGGTIMFKGIVAGLNRIELSTEVKNANTHEICLFLLSAIRTTAESCKISEQALWSIMLTMLKEDNEARSNASKIVN
jgi:hypothetical protein